MQETYGYNNRLQLQTVLLGVATNWNQFYCLFYNYYSDPGLLPTQCGGQNPKQGSGDNGSVTGYAYFDEVNGSLSHTARYAYDSLNRLATAVATGSSTYNLTFEQTVNNIYSGYDRYGNMTCVLNAQKNGPCPLLNFSAATNQISTPGYTYDASGNLTNDGTHTYEWDAEGRLISLDNKSTSSWIYNALGQKVEKTSVIPHSYTHERLYDPQGLLNSFWNTSTGGWGFRYVRLGGRAIAFDNNGSNESFEHLNNLGSVTMVTQANGSLLSDQQFYPWGDYWTGSNPSDVIWASTTGSEGFEGLADTPNRDYSLGLGRWMSPDPLAGDITNPQSLNRYAYALNNPTTLTDPTGLDVCDRNPNARACTEPYPRDAVGAGPPGFGGLFGVDEFDLAAAGLLPIGPPSAALPGCGAQFATCVPYSGGPLGFDITGIHDLGGNGLDCAMGEGCEAAGIAFLTLQTSTPNNGEPPSACELANIAAVNSVSNLHVSVANVVGTPFVFNGALNVNFSIPGASPSSLPPGRYPSSFLDKILGIGRSLHVPPAGGADPSTYGIDPITGNFTFTTHIDAAYATWHTPVGALIHYLVDVQDKGAHRAPCGGIR